MSSNTPRDAQSIELLRVALETDLVLTGRQVEEFFGLDPRHPSFYNRDCYAAPTKNAREVRVTFVAAQPEHLRLSTAAQRHLALTAEIRHAYGIEPDEWSVSADKESLEQPDAIWHRSTGESVAIEIDVGTYSKERIVHKLLRYSSRYSGQVWGTPSKKRLLKIASEIEALGIKNVKLATLRFP